jgi:hypothetical protein
VALEMAVAEAGHGPMPFTDRWLLVGSVSVVFLCLATIQLAATPPEGGPGRSIVWARLVGIPFLLLMGLFSSLESQWVALGVLGVCVAEIVSDMSAPDATEAQAFDEPEVFDD